jgi:DNA-binding protein YbaB
MEVKALQQMLAQFRQVQEKLEKQIGEISVEASAGGGMVCVTMNEATRRVDEELSKQVKDLTGGMPGIMGLKIPGLF